MVNEDKIKKHLPGLLIDGATTGNDRLYQKTRRQIAQAQADPIFTNKFDRLCFALTEIDIYFDGKGELTTKHRNNKR